MTGLTHRYERSGLKPAFFLPCCCITPYPTPTKANLRVTLGDDWFYKDGKLQQIRDYLAQAEAERDLRMVEITARIDWLEAAQKDGDISAEEETELAALRASRTKLRRLDFSNVTDKESYSAINWPEKAE